MTPTPRTDAQVWTPYAGGKQDVVWASFARELECENTRLREALDRIVALGARMPEDAEEV